MVIQRVYMPLFFALILHFFFPYFLYGAHGKELQEILSSGTINWSKGIITATGSGAPPSSAESIAQGRIMAKRAAILDARRNLLETVRGVRVNATTTVQNHMTASDRVITRVSGIVKMSKVVDARYLSDGIVEVTVAMDLRGDLLS